jgi:trans-aconitate 2-methyltransferase
VTADWNPNLYLKFADERTRPARDLLAQVPIDKPETVYDLGCGPGNSTELLLARYPGAMLTGVDNSPAMLAKAAKACPAAAYVEADLSAWQPPGVPDLLYSNATFQWVPDHLSVLERLAATLKDGGALAVQMPDNLDEPSHALMRETAAAGPWAGKLSAASGARDILPAPRVYYGRLKPLFAKLDIWHTAYNHPLDGHAGIVSWLSSTGLKPFIDPLTAPERQDFIAAYTERLAKAYPLSYDGTVLLRFPRLFLVGTRARP